MYYQILILTTHNVSQEELMNTVTKNPEPTIYTLYKEDKIAVVIGVILLMVLASVSTHEYSENKVCKSKGGVYNWSTCFKKEMIIE